MLPWKRLPTSVGPRVFRSVTLLHGARFASDVPSGSTSSKKTAMDDMDEDPATLLKQLQQEMRERAAQQEAPPTPQRRSGKTAFFDGVPTSQGSPSASNASDKQNAQDGAAADRKNATSSHADAPSTPFLQKLSKMEAHVKSPSFPTYDAAAEQRRQNIEEKVKSERAKMLVFRDVGMDLDKPILSRDVFLVFKYFRYGSEFAVDNELERMLRYFNEHAVNELKIIQNSKLMRGPATLSKKVKARTASRGRTPSDTPSAKIGSSLSGEAAASFQITSTFPVVQCANVKQFCPTGSSSSSGETTIQNILRPNPSQSFFSQFFVKPSTATPPSKYSDKDAALFTPLGPSSFRRPTVVIYTQLGQKFGSQADEEWRRLAYETICPDILPFLPSVNQQGEGHIKSAKAEQGLRSTSARGAPSGKGPASQQRSHQMPIDVISLRSADIYSYHWVHRMYIQRFAKTLQQLNEDGGDEKAARQTDNAHRALLAGSTFVGTKLLEPFYTAVGLRNYLSPHVMLIDHEGVIRWLSSGCPDAYERGHFPSLLSQLETEFYKARC